MIVEELLDFSHTILYKNCLSQRKLNQIWEPYYIYLNPYDYVYGLPVVEAPNIPVPAVFVWGVPNILPVGWATGVPKENPDPTGFDCPNDVLGLLEPNNPPPVFPPIEAFCWPNKPPVDVDVAVGVPNSEVPPVLKPNEIILFYLTFYSKINSK